MSGNFTINLRIIFMQSTAKWLEMMNTFFILKNRLSFIYGKKKVSQLISAKMTLLAPVKKK